MNFKQRAQDVRVGDHASLKDLVTDIAAAVDELQQSHRGEVAPGDQGPATDGDGLNSNTDTTEDTTNGS